MNTKISVGCTCIVSHITSSFVKALSDAFMLIANWSLYQYALIDISAVVDSAILATIIYVSIDTIYSDSTMIKFEFVSWSCVYIIHRCKINSKFSARAKESGYEYRGVKWLLCARETQLNLRQSQQCWGGTGQGDHTCERRMGARGSGGWGWHTAVHINKIQLFASIQEPPTDACVCCLCVCTEVGHIHGLVWFLWVIRCPSK